MNYISTFARMATALGIGAALSLAQPAYASLHAPPESSSGSYCQRVLRESTVSSGDVIYVTGRNGKSNREGIVMAVSFEKVGNVLTFDFSNNTLQRPRVRLDLPSYIFYISDGEGMAYRLQIIEFNGDSIKVKTGPENCFSHFS